MSQAGKGDKPRPKSIDRETYNTNWDNIFNNKEQKEQKEKGK